MKVIGSQVIHLYSAFYISCLCENVNAMVERTPPRYAFPSSPPSPTIDELEVQAAKARCMIVELEKKLSDRKGKIEQIQERSAEYVQHINQIL